LNKLSELNYTPAKIDNVFYENPLNHSPQVSTDLINVMMFNFTIMEITKIVNEGDYG